MNAELPALTRRLVIGVAVVAGMLVGGAIGAAGGVDGTAVALVAGAVATGEALRLRFPAGGGQSVRLAPSDAAILAAVVLTEPAHVGVGAAIGVLVWQAIDRHDAVKVVFTTAQSTVAAMAAALTFRAFVDVGSDLSPRMLAPYLLACTVHLVLGSGLVAVAVSSLSAMPLLRTWTRTVTTALVVTAGSACLGLLAVGLADEEVYLLPALGVPALFVMAASRLHVSARVQQERAGELVEFERSLAATTDPRELDAVLVDGLADVLGASAAVWRDGRWVTDVPPGSGPCRVPVGHPGVVQARATSLGPRADAPAVAVATRDAVVVAWGTDLGLVDGSEDWVRRLVRSAAEHADRVRAHAELLRERRTLQQVVDGTADGIYLLDAAGKVRLVNPAMAALVGRPSAPESLAGVPAEVAFGPGSWTTTGARDHVPAGDHQPAGRCDRTWRVSVAALGDDGAAGVRVGVVHDVSAERRAARMKDDMLAVVSHELRTPLTPIKAVAQLLSSRWDAVDAEQRSLLLGQLSDRADHLARLVEDLLLVAQLSAADGVAPAPRWAVTDLAAVVIDDVVAHDGASAKHPVIYDGPESLPGVTDPSRLRQVLDNLVDNACKYSAPGSQVVVRLRRCPGDRAELAVIDSGHGIPPADVERVFERFERVEDPLVQRTSGAGLGLYIVRSIVRSLGGTLDVHSTLGVGTSMLVSLPLRPAEAPLAALHDAGSTPVAR